MLCVEGFDDAVFFLRRQQGLLVFAVFDLGAELGGIDEDHVAVVTGVEKEDGDVGAGGGKDVTRHGDDSGEHLVFHEVLADLFVDPALGGDESGRHDDGGFTRRAEGVNDVLDEEQVDRHRVLLLAGHFRHAGEEAALVGLAFEFVAEVAEVELEGRVRDDVVELLQAASIVLMLRVQDGVALNDVGDGVNEVVQDQIEAQQTGGLLGNILRVEAALFFADLMGEIHQQGPGTCGGIVAGDVVARIGDEAGGHDLSHGVRGVILGVFAAAVFVVVFDQILEKRGEEVEFLGEDLLEAEMDQLIDHRLGELVALRGDVFGNGLEEDELFAFIVGHGEDIGIECGDVDQSVVEDLGKAVFVLAIVEAGEEVLGLELGGAAAELSEQHLVVVL